MLVYRVAEYEAKNKMGVSNLVSLFGPTMMTVDGDPVSQLLFLATEHTLFRLSLHFILPEQITFANTKYECNCISTMIKYYKWLFQVDEEEEKKEEVGGSGVLTMPFKTGTLFPAPLCNVPL